jgi:hypothetical protein
MAWMNSLFPSYCSKKIIIFRPTPLVYVQAEKPKVGLHFASDVVGLQIWLTQHSNGIAYDLRRGLPPFDDLPPEVSPTSGTRDPVAGHYAVAEDRSG